MRRRGKRHTEPPPDPGDCWAGAGVARACCSRIRADRWRILPDTARLPVALAQTHDNLRGMQAPCQGGGFSFSARPGQRGLYVTPVEGLMVADQPPISCFIPKSAARARPRHQSSLVIMRRSTWRQCSVSSSVPSEGGDEKKGPPSARTDGGRPAVAPGEGDCLMEKNRPATRRARPVCITLWSLFFAAASKHGQHCGSRRRCTPSGWRSDRREQDSVRASAQRGVLRERWRKPEEDPSGLVSACSGAGCRG